MGVYGREDVHPGQCSSVLHNSLGPRDSRTAMWWQLQLRGDSTQEPLSNVRWWTVDQGEPPKEQNSMGQAVPSAKSLTCRTPGATSLPKRVYYTVQHWWKEREESSLWVQLWRKVVKMKMLTTWSHQVMLWTGVGILCKCYTVISRFFKNVESYDWHV